jgi:hypothetical protein
MSKLLERAKFGLAIGMDVAALVDRIFAATNGDAATARRYVQGILPLKQQVQADRDLVDAERRKLRSEEP